MTENLFILMVLSSILFRPDVTDLQELHVERVDGRLVEAEGGHARVVRGDGHVAATRHGSHGQVGTRHARPDTCGGQQPGGGG